MSILSENTHISSVMHIPITINVIIESYFFMPLDITFCEYPHSNVVSYCPFCYIAVWTTTVVCKASDTAMFCGIDELRMNVIV